MKSSFTGWDDVARRLRQIADADCAEGTRLNEGQRASLLAIADRIPDNGIVIADEVGMGKTRIAAYVAKAVSQSGGRCAVVIPPGLGFQWQAEFRACDTDVASVIRSLQGYFQPWGGSEEGAVVWFRQPVVMISHRFSDWRLGRNPQAWRWCLLPEIYAAARQRIDGRLPRGYRDHADTYAYDLFVQRVACAARSITHAVPLASANPARQLLTDLLAEVRWPEPLDSQNYGRDQPLRDWLEHTVGLGLGVFDLVIIDEAHKSRGDDSGLTRVLEKVILAAGKSRRLALTATPIELDVEQWISTLQRIAVRPDQLGAVTDATRRYAGAVHRLRLGWRGSVEVRETYAEAARRFQDALSPYLLRRDKRQDVTVRKFAEVGGLSDHDYRRQSAISVEFDALSLPWRQAICAAEALSLIEGSSVDAKAKRFRLTIGNGHGISSVIDETLRHDVDDQKQAAFEDPLPETAPVAPTPSAARAAWWADTLRRAFTNGGGVLFDHPAIMAAVHDIEREVGQGEKVLVFGRFTRPLRALVSILNARQMLMRVATDQPWPQRKVHGDKAGREVDSEWPAVYAAHRQLRSLVDLATLDDLLAERYRRDIEQRSKLRDTLVPRLRAGLSTIAGNAKYLAILDVIDRDAVPTSNDPDDDDRHLMLLSRAITANLENSEGTDADYATAFVALVNAAGDRENLDDDEFDEGEAANAWRNLEGHLAESFANRQGGFARLMYGETKPQARRMMQLAFNRSNSFPRVLVAQSLVGREGLNLHESCRIVVLLHPEWNPGVVEQQIGRIDRVGCRWAKELERAIGEGRSGNDLPRIDIRPVIFKGTYDEHNWKVLQERWDDLRAQLHGEPVPSRLRSSEDEEGRRILDEIEGHRPDFSPLRRNV